MWRNAIRGDDDDEEKKEEEEEEKRKKEREERLGHLSCNSAHRGGCDGGGGRDCK